MHVAVVMIISRVIMIILKVKVNISDRLSSLAANSNQVSYSTIDRERQQSAIFDSTFMNLHLHLATTFTSTNRIP